VPQQATFALLVHRLKWLIKHKFCVRLTVGSGVGASREGLLARDVSDDEGNRLLRMVRRSSGSVVSAAGQIVLLSLQYMDVAAIARVTFTNPDRVREVINDFSEDGFESLYPKYAGGEEKSGAGADNIAEARAMAGHGDPGVVFSVDEFGPLKLLPRDGQPVSAGGAAVQEGFHGGDAGPPPGAPKG
jgi:hypothetical protein